MPGIFRTHEVSYADTSHSLVTPSESFVMGSNEPDSSAAVTRLLNEVGQGDPRASAALLPLVYEQLRRLARQKMRQERSDQTLQATALVHEAYLRLIDPGGERQWVGRWHFFAAAAEAMRRILVDHARHRSRIKRGGARARISLDDVQMAVDDPPDDLLLLDDALSEFDKLHPKHAQLVKLRFFAGLTNEQAAEALGISSATADRHWAFARAWLYRRIGADA
jgi:RNA polymerase sigma factor (TIGR02999 family)